MKMKMWPWAILYVIISEFITLYLQHKFNVSLEVLRIWNTIYGLTSGFIAAQLCISKDWKDFKTRIHKFFRGW